MRFVEAAALTSVALLFGWLCMYAFRAEAYVGAAIFGFAAAWFSVGAALDLRPEKGRGQ